MSNLRVLTICAALAATSACEVGTPAAKATQQGSPPPVASVRQVMLGITVPASNAIFQVSVGPPKDDVGWEQLEASAFAVAESANLLRMPPRAVDQREWLRYCNDLTHAANETIAAVRHKNVGQVLDAGNKLYEACDTCHMHYMAARGGV